jgi:transposase
MSKIDARKLDAKTLTELRIRAVTSIQEGEKPSDVARILGVTKQAVYNWLSKNRSGGLDNLDAKKRGGRPALLDWKTISWIYDTVTMKDPRQLKFEFALWTCKMIVVLIKDKFGIKLSRWSVMRLLNQLGLSAQRPMWRAYQQNPEAVEKWINEEYPKIQRLAKQKKAEIYFGDEAGVRSDHHAGTTWGIKGRTPVVSSTGARFGMNLISAVSPKGSMRFMVVEGRVGAKEVIEFMKRLLVGARRPIFLILDGHPAHKAKLVKKFIDSTNGKLSLFFLPPYSPERNPDEYLWNDVKNHLGKSGVTCPDQMKKTVLGRLQHLAKSPEKIRGFFQTRFTCYAV